MHFAERSTEGVSIHYELAMAIGVEPEVAQRVLGLAGGALGLASLSEQELRTVLVKPAARARLRACLAVALHLQSLSATAGVAREALSSPAAVATLAWSLLSDQPNRERLAVLFMDTRYRYAGNEILATGDEDSCPVSVAQVLRVVLLAERKRFLLVHNHPTGDCSPSQADLELFRLVKETAKGLDLSLVDAVIVGPHRSQFWSAKANGFF